MPLSGTILGVNNILKTLRYVEFQCPRISDYYAETDDSLEFEELLPANEYSIYIDNW